MTDPNAICEDQADYDGVQVRCNRAIGHPGMHMSHEEHVWSPGMGIPPTPSRNSLPSRRRTGQRGSPPPLDGGREKHDYHAMLTDIQDHPGEFRIVWRRPLSDRTRRQAASIAGTLQGRIHRPHRGCHHFPPCRGEGQASSRTDVVAHEAQVIARWETDDHDLLRAAAAQALRLAADSIEAGDGSEVAVTLIPSDKAFMFQVRAPLGMDPTRRP